MNPPDSHSENNKHNNGQGSDARQGAQFSYQDLAKNLSMGKLFLLGLISIALCSFAPLSFFASVPMSVAILLYGRQKSLILGASLLLISSYMASVFPPLVYLPFIYFGSLVLGVLNSEVIFRKWHPMKGISLYGVFAVLVIFLLVGLLIISSDQSVQQFSQSYVDGLFLKLREQNAELLQAGGEQARYLEDLLNNSKQVGEDIVKMAPAMIFVVTFFSLWASLFLVLRNDLIWKLKHAYPYGINDLIRFKAPDFFLFPLIGGLALTLLGDIVGDGFFVLGQNILYGVGVFYFFQGFGVYIQFLDFARIFGFLRTLLVMMMLLFAFRLIVLIGIFDVWVNFPKYFKKMRQD